MGARASGSFAIRQRSGISLFVAVGSALLLVALSIGHPVAQAAGDGSMNVDMNKAAAAAAKDSTSRLRYGARRGIPSSGLRLALRWAVFIGHRATDV
jgi:hypothetical protein